MKKDLKFLVDIVKKASKLITTNLKVENKGNNGDLVTNFDFEIEKFLISKIKKRYPTFAIISEEFNGEENPTDNYFTIDPIDGTINFANGLPLWGIQIACVKNGETCAAVIYLPILKECYCADETGAYKNGKLIHVNTLAPEKVLYVADSHYVSPKEILCHRRGFYCCAVLFSWIACGKLGAIAFPTNSYMWDVTPGMFIVKQAGGYILQNEKFFVTANSAETAKYYENLFK